MPELKNLRREKFAHLIVQGRPAKRAYTEAGFKASTVHSAEAAGSALMRSIEVSSRIAELRLPITQDAQLTTTMILDRLRAIGLGDTGKLLRWSDKGVKLADSDKLTADQRAMVADIRVVDGAVSLKLRDPAPALRLLGAHMGLFSGEVGATPGDTTVINNDNRTVVYVDRPPDESAEQWEARNRRRLGIDEPVRRGTVDATNGSAKRGH